MQLRLEDVSMMGWLHKRASCILRMILVLLLHGCHSSGRVPCFVVATEHVQRL